MDEWMNQRNVFYAMDNGGPPNSQQFRPLSYADVCRPGTLSDPSSALSAAYHSRYLASLPLSTTPGSSHPFLGGMFPSSSIPPATSFRATSAGLRQFWPPTPPPEGYGRYGINTSLFPLFGTVSPPTDTSAYMTVSRLSTASHLPHLVDNQKVDQSFLTPGYNMPSPLTCGSHVHPTTTFSPVIPGLETHASFSHMSLNAKDMPQGTSESHNSKAVVNPYKHDKFSSNQRAKAESLLDKVDHRKLSSSSSSSHKDKQEDIKPVRKSDSRPNSRVQSQTKLSPCEIEINYQSSAIKADILSPPLESPKPISPKLLVVRKQECSPMNSPTLIPSAGFSAKSESQCLTCAAHLKGVDVVSKSGLKKLPTTENVSEFLGENKGKSDLMSHVHISPISAEMSSAMIGRPPLKSGSPVNSFNDNVLQENSQPVHPSFSDAIYNPNSKYFPMSSKQQREVTSFSKISHSPMESNGNQVKKTTCNTDFDKSKKLEIKLEASDSKLCNNQVGKLEVISSPPVPNKCKSNSPSRIKVVEPQKVPKACQNTSQVSENTYYSLASTTFNSNMPTQNSSSKSYTMNNTLSCNQQPIIYAHSEENANKYSMSAFNASSPCSSSPKASAMWVKAAISPYNSQKDVNSVAENHHVANLSIKKQVCEVPVSTMDQEVANVISSAETVKISVENLTPVNTGVVGVCHPNSKKTIPVATFESKLSSLSPASHSEIATEVHVSSKSSFQAITHSPTPMNGMKGSSVLNTSIHSKTLKSERMTARRTKVGDMEKILSRSALATLAPKLTKKATFLSDNKASHHTIATSSSVSSTSIVFPASVNPCIPVGIAIAQQRQDTSASSTVGKVSSIPSTTPVIVPSVTHPTSISSEIQPAEILRDQKPQDTSGNADPTNYLVAQGPTILSRQWESEAVTRATLPSPWVAHGPIVAPALWIGQGAYAAATTPNTTTIPAPPPTTAPVETSPIALPPGGYQLARDSITGHLFLIPAANIVERTPLWPSYGTSTPLQQVVTQQHHTQFEQVMPQVTESEPIQDCLSLTMQQTHMGEPNKELDVVAISSPSNNMALSTCKPEEHLKNEDKRDCSVPMASGQTFTFTTFPTNCDPSSFSYVLQSSTVMHLAHTQTASSLQSESGKRSQGTSPLHCASPSPSPTSQETSVDDESDNDSENVACSETTQVELFQQHQSVTTAIQVDMDSQTNSEEDEDDSYHRSHNTQNVQMSDSAIQTESLVTDSEKSDMGEDFVDFSNETSLDKRYPVSQDGSHSENSRSVSDPLPDEEEKVVKGPLEVLPLEAELAPSLPVESQPVMDFIDHHGLNLLVDSIEEFASREKSITQQQSEPVFEKNERVNVCDKIDYSEPKSNVQGLNSFGSLDPSCTDGLGLLCALAEQRFLEESLNVDNEKKEIATDLTKSNDFALISSTCSNPSTSSWEFDSTQTIAPEYVPEHLKACELEMRKRLADLQRKYKEKELELARLNPNIILDKTESERPKKKELGKYKKKRNMKSFATSKIQSALVLSKKKAIGSKSLTVSTQRTLIVKKSYFQQKKMKMLNKSVDSLSRVQAKKKSLIKQKKSAQFHKIQHIQPDRNKLAAARQRKVYGVSQKSKTSFFQRDGSSSGNGIARKKNISTGLQSSHLLKRAKSIKHGNNDAAEKCFHDMKSDDSKQPIFDESAWFIRRSERIFLSDARLPISQQPATNDSPKKTVIQADVIPVKPEAGPKEKKVKLKAKPASPSSKKQDVSESSDSASSTSDSESSNQSDNIPLCRLIEQTSEKEKCKHSSIDSDESSALSEDIPLSVLKVQNSTKAQLKSCILTPAELQDRTRVLILDEGLFYAGHITAIQAPDVYGIILDGERAHRPHIFSREEILNAAVLEIKPDDISQLPEGYRICAYWSQQYRCLYPGTVAKATSPLPDSAILFVEFDDGDSGRIPLEDIRILPPDFPIVSMEPNPLLILGKRRARIDSECANEQKKCGSSSGIAKCGERESKKFKKQKMDVGDEGTAKSESLSLGNFQPANEHVRKSESPKRKGNDNSKISSGQSGKISEKEPNTCRSKARNVRLSSTDGTNWSMVIKPKKHKKHKDDHKHHHRHHRHHHHHHKKHKTAKQTHSPGSSVVSSVISKCDDSRSILSSDNYQTFCAEQKSELTMKIKTSPSPHTTLDQEMTHHDGKDSTKTTDISMANEYEPQVGKKNKTKKSAAEFKPEKRKERVPSVEKSKIAAFLPVMQLWRWSGKGYKRPGAKGKGKKEFFKAIQRGKELLRVGDCAVFLSTGRPHLPYIGRIETMWESWGGKMDVKVKWFYHPEETKSSKKLVHLKQGALFQSPHFDENDVQTISHKCEVLPWEQYLKKKQQELTPERASYSSMFDNNDTYYLAGTYDPITGSLVMEADMPKLPLD